MDTGPEQISDAEELRRVRRQARTVYVKSFVAAAILTGIVLVLS
jgi:hypothetical protein